MVYAACGVVRRRDALLHFRTELTDKSIALQAAAVTAAVQGNVPGDPGEECVEVIAWLMGWDCVPRLHVGVVFTFLGGLRVLYNAERQSAQPSAIFFILY